ASNEIIARPSLTALLQGRLEELPLMRCPRPAGWLLHVNGQQIYVDFGTNEELLAKAKKLHKMLVEISGTLEDTGLYEDTTYHLRRAGCDIAPIYSHVRILHVTSLTALADPEGSPIEITGVLKYGELESYPPIPVWTVETDRGTYNIRFSSASLADRAR